MLWVSAVRSSQNQYDDSSEALLPHGTPCSCQRPAAGGKFCQLWEPSCGRAVHWAPCTGQHTQESQTFGCQAQWRQYLCCFKLCFSTQKAWKVCFHSGATDILLYPWDLSTFKLSFSVPSFPPCAPLLLPQLICCMLFHAVTPLVEPNLLSKVDY